MDRRTTQRFLCIVLLLIFTLGSIFATDNAPWYMGRRIASFSNKGLVNADENTILDIQFKYLGKPFTDQLFNELQGELYGLEYFLYFLAEAERTGEGNNELNISFDFFELPYITTVFIEGNQGLKTRDITDVLLSKTGTFLEMQSIERSKESIVALYQEKGYATAEVDASYVIDDVTNTVVLTFTIDEQKQQRIGEIVFEGNEKVGSDILRRQLESKQIGYFNPGYFNPNTILRDREKLSSYYQSRGYLDIEVLDVRTEDISNEDDQYSRLRVIYPVVEGEQWFFGGIEVQGNTVFSDEQFQALVTMKKGSVLDLSRVQKELSAVTDLYWNNGYIFNLISSDMVRDEETNTITFILNVQENQQAIIEEIRFEGLTKTKEYVFSRELTFSEGDIFSKEKLMRSAQNIYNTLIVTDVQFDIINGSEEGKVIPVFTVVEGNQMDIQFGATFGGNVDGFPVSGFLQWSDKNLGGTGRDLAIATNLSPDTQSFSITFSDGWFANRRWSNGISFNFERSQKTSVLQRGIGSDYFKGHGVSDFEQNPYPLGYESYASYIAANQALPASRHLMDYTYYRVSLGYNTGYTFMFRPGALSVGAGLSIGFNYADYDKNLYDPYENLIKLYNEGWKLSNRLSLSFAWDGRDRIENTSRGYYLSQTFSYAGGVLGGLSNYIRSSTSASGFVKLFSFELDDRPANVVLGATTTVSAMLPQYYNQSGSGWGWYEAKQGATRYEMLYIDGMNTGRGFNVVFDQAYLWDNQVSISWPLAHNVLSAEIYASATGAKGDLDDIHPSSLAWYYSIGAGVKLRVPGFPLGLYLVKNASYINDTFTWVEGPIFKSQRADSGLKLVLAITTTLY